MTQNQSFLDVELFVVSGHAFRLPSPIDSMSAIDESSLVPCLESAKPCVLICVGASEFLPFSLMVFFAFVIGIKYC